MKIKTTLKRSVERQKAMKEALLKIIQDINKEKQKGQPKG